MKYIIIAQIVIIFVLIVFVVYQKAKHSNVYEDLLFDYQQTYSDYKDEQMLREVERVVNDGIYENKLKEKDEYIARLKRVLHASETKRKELCDRLHATTKGGK